jgi:hypothetical protein
MATADTYTAEQRDFLMKNAPNMRYNELCDLFNLTFDETKTLKQIRKWCAYHGIRGISSRDFTPDQERFIIENQYGMTREQLAKMFNERFGTSVSGAKIKSWCQHRGIRNANSGRFEDGNVSWQTGLHGDEYWSHFSDDTKAKVLKHLVEVNQKYKDGDVVMRHGVPAIYKKVSSGNSIDANLTYASTAEWERHFGAVPEDSIIIHIDGDVKNYAIDNLRLIPRAYLPILKHLGGLTDNSQMNRVKLKYCELFTALKSA